MILNLIDNQSSNNTINKVLVYGTQYSVNLKANIDLRTPDIILKDIQGDVKNYNYCELVELGRKYFIDYIESIGNDFYRIYLICDVLETYKADILNSNARMTRAIRTGDYIQAELERAVNSEVELFNSDKGFSGESSMILTTIGS